MTVSAVALLGVLSIAGAFRGAEEAGKMFNSPPLVVYWFLLAGLFLAGLIAFRRLVRSPGLLVVHLGSLALLVGAMLGSERGHGVVHALGGSGKIYSGSMVINQGEAKNVVVDQKTLQQPVGHLPFQLKLERFWIEYYPLPPDEPWQLVVDAAVPCSDDHAGGHDTEWRQALVESAPGTETILPFTEVKLKVLSFLPAARPVYPENVVPMLEITGPDGKKTSLPVKVGAEISLDEPKVKLRIAQVFSSISVERVGEELKSFDRPGRGGPPALKVEVEQPDKPTKSVFVYPKVSAHGAIPSLHMEYAFPKPVSAVPETGSTMPALELLLSGSGREMRKWLVPEEGDKRVQLTLTSLTGGQKAYLIFALPQPQVSDYKSELVVLDKGKEVARKVIEVNHPLHFGGYHFYQHSYDQQHGRYTVLSVSSDSGLTLVYAGFAALLAGVFWLFWVAPVVKYFFSKAKGNGN